MASVNPKDATGAHLRRNAANLCIVLRGPFAEGKKNLPARRRAPTARPTGGECLVGGLGQQA
jgi:hypothetical protein